MAVMDVHDAPPGPGERATPAVSVHDRPPLRWTPIPDLALHGMASAESTGPPEVIHRASPFAHIPAVSMGPAAPCWIPRNPQARIRRGRWLPQPAPVPASALRCPAATNVELGQPRQPFRLA